jgi:hypothetical protein
LHNFFRVVLANRNVNPHQFYASRRDAYWDNRNW